MTARWLYSIRCIFAGFLLVTVLTAAARGASSESIIRLYAILHSAIATSHSFRLNSILRKLTN